MTKIVYEVACETIGNPAFCLALFLTDIHFWSELQHFVHVGGQKKIKCRPIRTQEVGGARLEDKLYVILRRVLVLVLVKRIKWNQVKSANEFKIKKF